MLDNDIEQLGLEYCIRAERERAALVALYHATDGANWENSANWLSEAPIGEWYGVTDDSGGHVTRAVPRL